MHADKKLIKMLTNTLAKEVQATDKILETQIKGLPKSDFKNQDSQPSWAAVLLLSSWVTTPLNLAFLHCIALEQLAHKSFCQQY